MLALDFFKKKYNNDMFYVITIVCWNYCNWGNGYGIIQNKKYKKGTWEFIPKNLEYVEPFFNNSCPYATIPYLAIDKKLRFKTFEEAINFVNTLIKKKVLPNIPIVSEKPITSFNREYEKFIYISQRPIEDIIGENFTSIIENMEYDENKLPKYMKGYHFKRKNDYGNIIDDYITDIDLDDNGQWLYKTKNYLYSVTENNIN